MDTRKLLFTLQKQIIQLQAENSAMKRMVAELAKSTEGTPVDQFEAAFKIQKEEARVRIMLQMEKLNPGIAAELDALVEPEVL